MGFWNYEATFRRPTFAHPAVPMHAPDLIHHRLYFARAWMAFTRTVLGANMFAAYSARFLSWMIIANLAMIILTLTAVVPRATANDSAPQATLQFETAMHTGGEDNRAVVLQGQDARWQLQVTQRADAPDVRDVTREVRYTVHPEIVEIDRTGFAKPVADGQAVITARLGEQSATIDVQVAGLGKTLPVNFPNQVVPIFTKLGCNGGGCHGKAAGQAGFKLSLLGFEPREDFEHLVNEARGRRIFPAVPSRSLLLQKAIGTVPHGGGKRLEEDSHEFRILERWIMGGMPYGSDDDPVVTRIETIPSGRRLERGESQQLSVIAHYSDGHSEDITRTAQYESNNSDLADVDEQGLVTLGQRAGDVAVMARYQGQVSVFRASIPLGIEVTQWPAANNLVDELVFAKLKTLGIPPSDLCSDATFVRRVTLDLAGRLPTVGETRAFLDSSEENRLASLVDSLLASTDHAEFFAKKWSTILRNRREGAGDQFGTFAFFDWLRTSFHENKPYDQFARELLTASGSLDTNPPVAWLREVKSTEARVEDAAQLFLGQRLQCARCHHHPFEKWSQKDYFQMAAFFSTLSGKEGDRPEEPRFVSRVQGASARHPKSGQQLKPAGLDGHTLDIQPNQDPREALADWMVAPDNRFFARALVNRYWKHFFATGLVEPEDDMRVTNPPTNPELLDGLADYFVQNKFDLKSLIRLICTSNAYRMESSANEYNLGDSNSYSRFYPKRLQAEVLLDAINQVTLTSTGFSGMPSDTRAVELPDTSYQSYFLDVFGKPDSATACECERSGEATLAQSLHLLNSSEVQAKLRDDQGRAAAMAASSDPLEIVIGDLYLAALSRQPRESELQTATKYLAGKPDQRREAFEDLVWAIINSKEFLFNH